MSPKHQHTYVFKTSYTRTKGKKTYVVRVYRCTGCGNEYFTEDPA